jgi:hypothetical protein
MGRRCIEFGVKRSNALDLEVEIRFPGSRVLCFPLTNTVSHMWAIHGRKMYPIEFGVNGQMQWTLK